MSSDSIYFSYTSGGLNQKRSNLEVQSSDPKNETIELWYESSNPHYGRYNRSFKGNELNMPDNMGLSPWGDRPILSGIFNSFLLKDLIISTIMRIRNKAIRFILSASKLNLQI